METDKSNDTTDKGGSGPDLSNLATLRDEIRVKLHLAEANVRDEFEKLEVKWSRLQGEVNRLRTEMKTPGQDVATLGREISEAYGRIGAALRRPV